MSRVIQKSVIVMMGMLATGVVAFEPPTVATLEAQAAEGDTNAMAMLGESLMRGEWGAEQDYGKARRLLEAAMHAGHPQGYFNLGIMYQRGWGVESDTEKGDRLVAKAFPGLLDAAGDADPRWQCNLAVCYSQGAGTERDIPAAIQWLKTSAAGDYARAYLNLMIIHWDEDTYELQDREAAIRWGEKAAGMDNKEALYFLAHCYDNAIAVDADHAKAYRYYHRAVEQGHVYAKHGLAGMYFFGRGIETDKATAGRLYREVLASEGIDDETRQVAEIMAQVCGRGKPY